LVYGIHHRWRRIDLKIGVKRKFKLSILLLSILVLITACGGGNTTEVKNDTLSVKDREKLNWDERKELNKTAGVISYTTGFYYAASPPDIQVVVAKELGYFEEMGLDVDIKPGLDAEGMKYLAAGQVQIASAGTPSIVIQSISSGAKIQGVATFAEVGTSALLVMNDSELFEPSDLVGKTIGYHGALPANLIAMFKHNNVDPTTINGVSVGYDPSILALGKIDALTVYKSNEPHQMKKMGYDVRIIDPGQFGAETSFGVVAVNNEFASKHPVAVEDFLRAMAKAHDYAVAHPDEAVAMLEALSESVYDVDAERNRWAVERELVESSKGTEHGIAWQSHEQWEREIKMLFEAGVISKTLDANQVMNNEYIDAIYKGTELIWRAE